MQQQLSALALNMMRLVKDRPSTGKITAWFLRVWGGRVLMKKIRESEGLQAFHHARPSYPLHILIVPKQAIPSFTGLGSDHPQILMELIAMVQELVKEFDLDERGYRLIVNGGPYQEIPQLHFHLVSGHPETSA